jgi:prepilin-type N-terminal cleavage/methylation domain-containing protein
MNYKSRIRKSNNEGYTLIETMIAVALFAVIVTMGMSALLNADSLYNKSKNMRSIMDSLSYTMDDMSRNLRTGYNYYCIVAVNGVPANPGYSPTNGATCAGIEFTPSTPSGSGPWAYEVATTDSVHYYIQKAIYNTVSSSWGAWVQMTPTEVSINSAVNAFSVFGALPPPDTAQPFVNIRLTGKITYKTVITSFSLQTSVSQRQVDI